MSLAAAGACATIAADGLMNPFDVIKQRLQLHGSTHKNMLDCAKTVFRNEGLRAFYVSYPTTLSMTIPFQSIHFAAYEYFRHTLNPKGVYDPKTHIISGALAGAMASVATNPLDVVKTLLQTRGSSSEAAIRSTNTMTEAAKIIYTRHGFVGFAKGLVPRLLTNMPSTAIAWTTYEFLKHFLSKE